MERLTPATVHYNRGLANLNLIDVHGLSTYFALDLRVLLSLGASYAARSKGELVSAERFLRTGIAFFHG